jgi:hypothetical protein
MLDTWWAFSHLTVSLNHSVQWRLTVMTEKPYTEAQAIRTRWTWSS